MSTPRAPRARFALVPVLAALAAAPAGAADSIATTSAWLPAAHVVGASGVFRTDVQIFNPDPVRSAEVTLYFTPAGVDGTNLAGLRIAPDLGPRASISLDDVVVATLGRPEGFGVLEVRSGEGTPVLVTSNTYNVGGALPGTYGQFSPGQPFRKAVVFDDSVFGDLYIIGLRNAPELRTNLALINPTAFPLEAGVQLVGAGGGDPYVSRAYAVPPFSIRQVNDLFEKEFVASGAPRGGPYRLNVFVNLANGARVLCYASVIDLRTGDPYLIPGEPTIHP